MRPSRHHEDPSHAAPIAPTMIAARTQLTTDVSDTGPRRARYIHTNNALPPLTTPTTITPRMPGFQVRGDRRTTKTTATRRSPTAHIQSMKAEFNAHFSLELMRHRGNSYEHHRPDNEQYSGAEG